MKKNNSLRARLQSFRYALQGLRTLMSSEPNIRIHLLATVVVIVAGIWREPGQSGWIALVIAIVLVWVAEAFNTAIEMLCDLYSDHNYHPVIKKIKDISAAAVFLAACASVVIAVFVFL